MFMGLFTHMLGYLLACEEAIALCGAAAYWKF